MQRFAFYIAFSYYNLNKNTGNKMPVYYFTELLAEALGVKEEVAK